MSDDGNALDLTAYHSLRLLTLQNRKTQQQAQRRCCDNHRPMTSVRRAVNPIGYLIAASALIDVPCIIKDLLIALDRRHQLMDRGSPWHQPEGLGKNSSHSTSASACGSRQPAASARGAITTDGAPCDGALPARHAGPWRSKCPSLPARRTSTVPRGSPSTGTKGSQSP
jgi:hypothetical protein